MVSVAEMIDGNKKLDREFSKEKLMEAEVAATQEAIAAVQKERDEAKKRLDLVQKNQQRDLDNKVAEMNHTWFQFCQSLDTDKWQ